MTTKTELTITGGKPITGIHEVPGNKNAALPMLTAALLTDEEVILTNLPDIQDVKTTIELLKALGVKADFDPLTHVARIKADDVRTTTLPQELCARVRATILFAGPMVARFNTVKISQPGGDVIGRRRIDTHISGLGELGATFSLCKGKASGYQFTSQGRLQGRKLVLDEASVTATENIIMAAVLAEGKTTIYNAACEPHVQDLCRMLKAMGANIKGSGTNYIVIDGVEKLHGCTARVGSDYIDAASYIVAALVTKGELTIKGIDKKDFNILGKAFSKFGVNWTITGDTLFLPGNQNLEIVEDIGGAIPKIEDGIWPACPSDLISILIVLAIYTEGTILFFEKMFESRLYFVDHLINMGAHIVQCDPHRIVVIGSKKKRLTGCKVSSPDIRAGIALVIAALAADGETTIHDAKSIDRGYESVDIKLNELGAKITRSEYNGVGEGH